MYIYNFDKITHEYTTSAEASIDPQATKREGKDVYLIPAYSTLKKPPKTNKYKVAVYENNTWVIKDDYRGAYICDELLNIQVVQEIGALPDGFIVITEGEAQQIVNDPLWYIVQDGELIKNPNYEEDKAKQRKEYISHLAMTKYDFFKYVCQPNNITYQQLIVMVNSNEQIATAWNLCGHVYRGDDTLCTYIEQFLPTLTSDVLDLIFEQHGKVINE